MLEEQSFRPLMFFLKCLSDKDEIDSLIKREIDCRTRFILCDSENARKSNWVKKEVEYIKSKDRIYECVDLSKSNEEILKILKAFKHRASLFISYSRKDLEFAMKVHQRLSEYDFFQPFSDFNNLVLGEDWAKRIKQEISKASFDGNVVILLSNTYINSSWGQKELGMVLEKASLQTSSIIPVILSKDIEDIIAKNNSLAPLLQYKGIDVSKYELSEGVDIAVDYILTKVMTPGVVLTHALNFRDGVNAFIDEVEADKLFHLYYRLAEEHQLESPNATAALASCYEFGYGVPVDLNMAASLYSTVIYSDGITAYRKDLIRVNRKIKEQYPIVLSTPVSRSRLFEFFLKIKHLLSN